MHCMFRSKLPQDAGKVLAPILFSLRQTLHSGSLSNASKRRAIRRGGGGGNCRNRLPSTRCERKEKHPRNARATALKSGSTSASETPRRSLGPRCIQSVHCRRVHPSIHPSVGPSIAPGLFHRRQCRLPRTKTTGDVRSAASGAGGTQFGPFGQRRSLAASLGRRLSPSVATSSPTPARRLRRRLPCALD